jgi:hypothetical protein
MMRVQVPIYRGTLLSVKNVKKVLERLAVTDKTMLAIEKAPDGKVRVTSSAWPDERDDQIDCGVRHAHLDVFAGKRRSARYLARYA